MEEKHPLDHEWKRGCEAKTASLFHFDSCCLKRPERSEILPSKHTALERGRLGWDESHDVPLVLTLVGGAVERIVQRNERAGAVQPMDGPGRMHLFFCNKAPSISVEMLVKKCPGLRVSNQNAHRLLISGVVLAAKFLDDRQYSNVHYAKVGGICTKELNMLELEMLRQLDFSLFVQPQLLNQYLMYLFESPKAMSFRAHLDHRASKPLPAKSSLVGTVGVNAP
eukprot:scaffold310_cov335-Pavlova_lutheri.AAC.83